MEKLEALGRRLYPFVAANMSQGSGCIMHLNIALQMEVCLYLGGKSHVANGQNVSFKEPCFIPRNMSGQRKRRAI